MRDSGQGPSTFPSYRKLGGLVRSPLRSLALNTSGRERMVYGRAAASREKRMDLSEETAWFGNILNFGDILTKTDRPSRSGPVRSLPIRQSVAGSSERGRLCARPDHAGLAWSVKAWSVGREREA